MHRLLLICLGLLGTMGLLVGPAFADSPHFLQHDTYVVSVSSDGTMLTVHFKESGLDNSANTVTIVTTATAECINGGGRHPKASNKQAESGSGTFSVSNGTASGDETVTETNISPSCDPPMTLAWTDVVVHDYAFNDSISLPGTFYAGFTR